MIMVPILMKPVVLLWERDDFHTAYSVFRFSESRLCGLLNTTLDDSRHDQQRDKDVPVLSTTFLLGDQFEGPKLQLQTTVNLPREGGREKAAASLLTTEEY